MDLASCKPVYPFETKQIKPNIWSNSVQVVCLHNSGLSVDIRGPVAQVEDEEQHWENDARDLVHFADTVVGLLGLRVGVIHPVEIGGVFGRRSGGALGNGR